MSSDMQYFGAVKAWLALSLIIFLIYVGLNTFMFIKTKYLTQKVPIFPIIPAFTRTLEIDLMPTFFIMCIVIVFGAFFGFMAFLGYALFFIVLPIFVVGRVKDNHIILKVAKFINIAIGIASFLDLFIDDLKFK